MNSSPEPSLIQIRPRQDTIHVSRGRTALCMGREGTIREESAREGLYVYGTRMLSRYRWLIERKEPQLSVASAVKQHSWLAYYYQAPPNCRDTDTHDCEPLQQTLELRVVRVVGEGMHEDVELTNHTRIATTVTLELEFNADFAARSEITRTRLQRGRLTRKWSCTANTADLVFQYEARHAYRHQGNRGVARIHRGITLHLEADGEPRYLGRRISFKITLEPHASWHACLHWTAEVGGNPLPLMAECNALFDGSDDWSRREDQFDSESASIHTPLENTLTSTARGVLWRAKKDLSALRLFDLDEGERNWKIAAGVPTYVAFFGRDSLTAARQASILTTSLMTGALSILAATQAFAVNDWRDAQPGRMLHEHHTDPVSVLNYTPHALYFGAFTPSVLYPILLDELWHWTGDRELVRPFLGPAIKALAWADEFSRDQSGFYKYQTRSEQGLKNQGWKDSFDCMVYPDGSQVQTPVGTCEMQGLAYAAKLSLAEVLSQFGRLEEAEKLDREAQQLRAQFNQTFWMEKEEFLAMALDNENHLVETIASEPGHCLLSGIVEPSRVERIAQRLLQPDMFSGWGIRTLSSAHPAYNPFAYHRGTVWPVENAAFVLAFGRCGLQEQMWTLGKAIFESAALFQNLRLPETFGGHQRDTLHPFPGLYEKADSPQAWSATAPVAVLQALLGLEPDAPSKTLFINPNLPEWLPEISLRNLQLGNARVTLRFSRNKNEETEYEIESMHGDLNVVREHRTWPTFARWRDRIQYEAKPVV